MEIRIKDCNLQATDDGKLRIGGYINVTNRESEMMFNKKRGKYFKETMQQGVFQRALDSSEEDIPLLLEHNWDKQLASVNNRNLVLTEDNIGLKFTADIEDRSVYEQVMNNEINSCSFGFKVLEEKFEPIDNLLEKRSVSEIQLMEVSLVKNPAYVGSLVETRNYEEELKEERKCGSDSKEEERECGSDSDLKKDEESKDKSEKSKDEKNKSKDKKDKDQENEESEKDGESEKDENRKCKSDENRSVEITVEVGSDNEEDDNSNSDNLNSDNSVAITVQTDDFNQDESDGPLTKTEITQLINELIQSKMNDIQEAENQEQNDSQVLAEIQAINSEIESQAVQQCMADSLEVINLRLDLLKLNQIKEGIQ